MLQFATCSQQDRGLQGEPRPKNGAQSPAEQIRKLTAENKRLAEGKAAVERRAAQGKAPAGNEEAWRLRDENRCVYILQLQKLARNGTRGACSRMCC